MWPTLRAWLRNPRRMGTVVPSGRRLAAAMAELAFQGDPATILEVGAGSGVITKALALRSTHRCRILVVDLDRNLLAHVPATVDRIQARAQRVPVRQADVVVSSLPLTSMREDEADQALAALRRAAPRIVLFQYARVRLPLVRRHFPSARIVARVWRNLPPAYVVAST